MSAVGVDVEKDYQFDMWNQVRMREDYRENQNVNINYARRLVVVHLMRCLIVSYFVGVQLCAVVCVACRVHTTQRMANNFVFVFCIICANTSNSERYNLTTRGYCYLFIVSVDFNVAIMEF